MLHRRNICYVDVTAHRQHCQHLTGITDFLPTGAVQITKPMP